MPRIIPFPASLGNSLNPNMVGFLPTSWNTKTQGLLTLQAIKKERAWKRMVLEWRREQLIRACLIRHHRSVSRPTTIYPMCFAPTTVLQNMVTTANIIPSLSLLQCHDPSHGGFYMAKGAFYIRIGLPPRVVSGDCLVLSRCGLIDCHLHCRRAYPMSRDWGCISTSYWSPYVLCFIYAALRAIL